MMSTFAGEERLEAKSEKYSTIFANQLKFVVWGQSWRFLKLAEYVEMYTVKLLNDPFAWYKRVNVLEGSFRALGLKNQLSVIKVIHFNNGFGLKGVGLYLFRNKGKIKTQKMSCILSRRASVYWPKQNYKYCICNYNKIEILSFPMLHCANLLRVVCSKNFKP